MNVALRRPMSVEDFLAWEERQALRYEFDGVAALAMVGGTAAHSVIQSNIVASLVMRLRGTPCQAHGSHMKIRVAERVRYPDAFVVCTPVSPSATWISEPVVVFEILSPGSSHDDLVAKNAEYQATPSIRRYVVLEQTHAAALVFHRKAGDWVAEPLSGQGAVLHMPELGIEIPLAEIYAGVAVQPEEAPAEPPDRL